MSTRKRGTLPARQGPPHVVLDAKVVLSALVFAKGHLAPLRVAWQSGSFLPLVSTATAQELVRVLAYPKFRLHPQAQKELLADYLPYAKVVNIPQPPPTVPACRDPFDLPFLHLACAGQALVLVTGDVDLLVLGRMAHCTIMSPDTYLDSQPPLATPPT